MVACILNLKSPLTSTLSGIVAVIAAQFVDVVGSANVVRVVKAVPVAALEYATVTVPPIVEVPE